MISVTPDSRTLDDYIASFYAEGQLDSQGRFSLDLNKSYQKMSTRQFSEPEKFVLPLIMAATTGGARKLRVDSVRQGFSIGFDGSVCTPRELEQLRDSLQRQVTLTGSPRLQHLQTALVQARALELGCITLCLSAEGEQATVLQIRQNQIQVRTPESVDEAWPHLSLQAQSGLLGSLFGSRIFKIRQSVDKLLAKRCSHGPAALPNSSALFEPNSGAHLIIGNGPPDRFLPKLVAVRTLQGRLSHLSFHGFLQLCEPPTSSLLLLVLNGISFLLPAQRGVHGCPYQCVLWSDGLACDLAFEELVNNEELQTLLRTIPLWLGELEWAQLLRCWALGRKAALEQQFGWQQTIWDARQRILHRAEKTAVVWNSEPPDLNLGEFAKVYAHRQFLPVSQSPNPGLLDNGEPIWNDSSELNWLVTQLFPRQHEYLYSRQRAVPRIAYAGRLLDPDDFWECLALERIGMIGLNRLATKYPGMVWTHRSEGGCLHLVEVQDPPFPLPAGITLALTPECLADQEACYEALCQLHRAAWCHPQTYADPARQRALLEHWLLAYHTPALRKRMDTTVPWIASHDGTRWSLGEIIPARPWLYSTHSPLDPPGPVLNLSQPIVSLLQPLMPGVRLIAAIQ